MGLSRRRENSRDFDDGNAGKIGESRLTGYYPSGPDWRNVQVDVDGKLVVSGGAGGGGALTDAELRASPVPVSGTVSVTEPVTVDGTVTADTELPAAAVLADNTVNPTVPGVGAFWMAWDGVTWDRGTQPLTDTQLRATPVPVSGPLTDMELRATPVPVSGTVAVTEPVSVDDNGGSLTVDGTVEIGATSLAALETIELGAATLAALESVTAVGPLTDAQLRAAPVPVSGTVAVTEPVSVDDNGGSITVDGTVELGAASLAALETIEIGAAALAALESVTVVDGGGSITVDGPLTDGQLRATPVPVSGTVAVTEPVSVDDNGGSLTVDGTVEIGAASLAALETTELGATTLAALESITVTGTVEIGATSLAALETIELGATTLAALENTTVTVGAALPAGSANIGDVDVASQAYGKTILRAVITQAAAGATVLVAASPGNKCKVVAYDFTLGADGTAKFNDGVGDLTGVYDIAQRGGKVNHAVAGGAFIPWFETAVNSALSITTTVGQAEGILLYVLEP